MGLMRSRVHGGCRCCGETWFERYDEKRLWRREDWGTTESERERRWLDQQSDLDVESAVNLVSA